VLTIILKNKKHNKILKENIKFFISEFGKTHHDTSNFSGVYLDIEVLE